MKYVAPLGFAAGDRPRAEDMRRQVMEELRATFKPEFLNRVDETIVFHRLGKEELLRITELLLERMRRRFAERGLTLETDAAALAWLARQGSDENYGARPLRRMLQRSIEDAAAELLLEGKAAPGDRLRARVDGDSLHLEIARDALSAQSDSAGI